MQIHAIRSSKKPIFLEVLDPGPKRPGTAAYDRYRSMTRFVAKHGKKATVVDVLENTSYEARDLRYDIERGFIRVRRNNAA